MNYTFAAARLTAGTFFNSLIKKGRGIGPMKPWQPHESERCQIQPLVSNYCKADG